MKKTKIDPAQQTFQKQFKVLKQFTKSASAIDSLAIGIVTDAATGATEATTNFGDTEKIAEMLACFAATVTVQNNIPYEDFIDIWIGYFEKFVADSKNTLQERATSPTAHL